jgi:hypothetical protein
MFLREKPSDGIVRHLVFAFVLAIGFYIICFSWIQHRRVFKGPWSVTFLSDATGHPSVMISEPKLNISETLAFPTQKMATNNMSQVEVFDEAVTNLPFGSMIFQDPTFLPGTVTMNLFSHQVELLPRVLKVDKKEIPWHIGQSIEIKD